MTHAELIAALEAATEPSWELDAEIARAIGAPVYPDLRAHRYTSSIDAALTLVPEGGGLACSSGLERTATRARVMRFG